MTQEGRGQPAGLDGILAWLDDKPTLSRHIGAARQIDQVHELQPELLASLRVLVIRNFTIEPIEPLLKVAAARAGMHVVVSYSGYDPSSETSVDEVLSSDPGVVFVALRVEELSQALTEDFLAISRTAAAELAEDALDRVIAITRAVRARSQATIFVHNFVPPVYPVGGLADAQDPHGQLNLIRRLNLDLVERLRAIEGAYVVDVAHVFAQLGLREAHDERGDRNGDAPLSQAALRALSGTYVRHIRARRGPAAKCVIVDCDNTLWGGVIGEDGIAGLALGETGEGRRFRDFQRALLNLRRRGILLAVCSKNEEADVLDVLRTHPDCALRPDDFAATRINWNDKADNVASIATELGIGLEHVVFVDDNPVECEWVRLKLPEVRVIQWTPDANYRGALDDLALFDSLIVTDEDRARTEMYRADSGRRAARDEISNIDDYHRSLQMRVVLGLARPEHLTRLAQLTQRTNQFNLTTRRYDVASLEVALGDPHTRIVWLDLHDRFGANGVVGCGIVRTADELALIDTLLLSCRVIGRQVEGVLVRELARLAREMGASVLVGDYLPTARNGQVADLYGRLGFDGPEAGPEGSRWRWSLTTGDLSVPDWFEISVAAGAQS